jgi:hypothetical protein
LLQSRPSLESEWRLAVEAMTLDLDPHDASQLMQSHHRQLDVEHAYQAALSAPSARAGFPPRSPAHFK